MSPGPRTSAWQSNPGAGPALILSNNPLGEQAQQQINVIARDNGVSLLDAARIARDEALEPLEGEWGEVLERARAERGEARREAREEMLVGAIG